MKTNLVIFIKGMLIGIVEIIPGVSGGTIALILGIYERLIKAKPTDGLWNDGRTDEDQLGIS